jgi:hypothetical protein
MTRESEEPADAALFWEISQGKKKLQCNTLGLSHTHTQKAVMLRILLNTRTLINWNKEQLP